MLPMAERGSGQEVESGGALVVVKVRWGFKWGIEEEY